MSQKLQILKALQKGKKLTPYSALKLCGTLRLSERVREIEREPGGYYVIRRWKKVGKARVMEYSL